MDEFLNRFVGILRYHTGIPRESVQTKVIPFSSERQFVETLHEGKPVVVAFTVTCTHTNHLDRVLDEASSQWHPHVKFFRVECPSYPGFCISRQRKDYPFIEVFMNSKQVDVEEAGKEVGPITKYSVSVLPFTYDHSLYGFREFFKRHGLA